MQSDMLNNVQLYGVGDGNDNGEMGLVVLRDVCDCRGGVSGEDSGSGSGGDS